MGQENDGLPGALFASIRGSKCDSNGRIAYREADVSRSQREFSVFSFQFSVFGFQWTDVGAGCIGMTMLPLRLPTASRHRLHLCYLESPTLRRQNLPFFVPAVSELCAIIRERLRHFSAVSFFVRCRMQKSGKPRIPVLNFFFADSSSTGEAVSSQIHQKSQ